MKKKYGENMSSIPEDVIKFKGKLENFTLLKNTFGDRIVYLKSQNKFAYIINSGSEFLTEEQVNSKWTKI